jgi:hypothetical protein
MRTTATLLTALALTAGLTATAFAKPALDAAGKCRDNGKFVAAAMCQTVAPAATKCRDVKTKKFAKCGTANTEPVPSK